jgi:hypothetical protein
MRGALHRIAAGFARNHRDDAAAFDALPAARDQ